MKPPLFIFAHGAGAPSAHPWMRHWAELLRRLGDVETFDYPYMAEGRKRPDPLPKLIAAHREALHRAQQSHAGPVVLIGKSMGSRVGCHLALEEDVAAVICLSYPLCGAGDRTKLRDKVLRELRTPILFVQGTRDSLCPLDLLDQVRREMTAPNELHVVEGGDHSLLVSKTQLKASCETQQDVDLHILEAIRGFLSQHLS
jgi:predicted alpha/beta-hydrolase family hydrolase